MKLYNSTVCLADARRKSKLDKILARDSEYREFVCNKIKKIGKNPLFQRWLVDNQEALLSVYLLDFNTIRKKLMRLYSHKSCGKRPCDPQVIMRSLLLMFAMKETTSITKWAKKIKTDSKLAIFCGIDTSSAPCEGTYYEFFKRMENGSFHSNCEHRILPSEQRLARDRYRFPKEKPEKEAEEQEEKDGKVIEHYVQKTKEREKEPIVNNLERYLNEILMEVGVKKSVEKGLIKDLKNMTMYGDGSTLASSSNPDGKRSCDCLKKKIRNCGHKRKYSDLDAWWGWNNRIKDFVYGYRFFQMTSYDKGHDLPVYLNINSANTHETKMAIDAIDNLTKMGVGISHTAFDSLFDIYAFYHYLNHKNILHAIPYKRPPAKHLYLNDDEQLFNQDGVPICPAGLGMKRSTFDKQRRHVYHCPVKRMARRNGQKVRIVYRSECPLQSLCEPHSKMGPFVYVSSDRDPRIHPLIPRNSDIYKQLLKNRSSCERSNSSKKHNYLLNKTHTRVMSYAFIRLAFVSILEHSRAWAKKTLKNTDILSLFSF